MTPFTFAYGSNLSREDWERFCRAAGADASVLQRVGQGFLPDRELCFSRWSQGRQGGVLGLRPRLGQAVDGWLFRVRSSEGWRLLEAKEGVPNAYVPQAESVLRARGGVVEAVVYDVRRPERWVEPAADYLELVRRARDSLHLDTLGLAAAAADTTPPWLVRDLFVYGTLRRGECRHGILEAAGIEQIVPATVAGRVVDLGPYPGLFDGRDLVQGECVTLTDPRIALARCDEVEGFLGWGRAGSLFRRALIRCQTSNGDRWAWHYRPAV